MSFEYLNKLNVNPAVRKQVVETWNLLFKLSELKSQIRRLLPRKKK